MRIQVIVLMGAAVLAAACAPSALERTTVAAANCGDEYVDVEWRLRGRGIFARSAYFKVVPENVRVRAGCRVILEFQAPVSAANPASTTAKLGAPAWLNGTPTAAMDQIILQVPMDQAPGAYEYNMTIMGIGMVDPRVTVEN